MNTALRFVSVLGLALGLSACTQNPYFSFESMTSGKLSDETVLKHATGEPLVIEEARLITDNDDAFRSKLALIEDAQISIDAMYFIFSGDYSSSVLAEALIAAAKRGVRVRLLLDYHTNYKRLDLFSMMEKQGNTGSGKLEVRFYNRPTRNIVMDAAYLTLGCGDVEQRSEENCAGAKLAAVQERFDGEMVDDRPAAETGISNLNVFGSGLFLSGLYGKNPEALALAVVTGQKVDLAKLTEGGQSATPEQKRKLLEVAKVYWASRTAPPFKRLIARIQLATYFAFAGDVLNPIYKQVSEFLPIERRDIAESARDWDYITDYLHHKLLLVDKIRVQLGGRNIEDSYHMQPNALIKKYVFTDTDAVLDLRRGGPSIANSFEELWNYRRMVATIAEIRSHAPNDVVANADALSAALRQCTSQQQATIQQACFEREFAARARSLPEREAARQTSMTKNARTYRSSYRPIRTEGVDTRLAIDTGAQITYLENLPFDNLVSARERQYGATNGFEAQNGKKIHALWLAAMQNACVQAGPMQVILHSAYFYPSSNLIRQFAEMVDGVRNCSNVTITVLTNSIDTTDLNVVNIFARHSLKAFAEYYARSAVPERSAKLRYFEYQRPPGPHQLSLHSKVSVLGDDIIVGSANADIRSYMMDTNNAIFIRNAPSFQRRYAGHIGRIINDPARTKNMTRFFMETDRQTMLQQDLRTFRDALKQYKIDKRLSAEQIAKAEADLVKALNISYAMVTDILKDEAGSRAESDFDRTFKGI